MIMKKALKIVNELIVGIEKYEKETGRKNPPAYISKEILLEIKQALTEKQDLERFTRLVMEKDVDIIRIRYLIFKSQKNQKYWDLRYYNEFCVINDENLTQEEFDFIKEMIAKYGKRI